MSLVQLNLILIIIFNCFMFVFISVFFVFFFFFFFQAEDGIRDVAVTGVQTCALPISAARRNLPVLERLARRHRLGLVSNFTGNLKPCLDELGLARLFAAVSDSGRSEERRVGKECRWRGWVWD